MSIDNRHDFLAWVAEDGSIVTDHLLPGSNVQLAPGTYTPDWDNNAFDSVTFTGTAGRDTLFGGGGEVFTFFVGTRGDDLYGTVDFGGAYIDYSGARTGVCVDMSYRGSRTFIDADGATRTVDIIGKSSDGFGGTDYFAEAVDWNPGYSSVAGIFGTAHRDVMIAADPYTFYAGGGNDLVIGGFGYGGAGNDRMIGRATGDFQYAAYGEDGDDLILGTDFIDFDLVGGAGDDRILAGDGDDGRGAGALARVTGNEGEDYVDGGGGDDEIEGGVGSDVLVSGPGNDFINPDVEEFFRNTSQPTDGARDVIRITRNDVGTYRDEVLYNAFEEGLDQIRFADAVRCGIDFRVYQEPVAASPGRVNTVLQIDQDGDGLGGGTPDADDYLLVVQGADLALHDGYLLT